MRLATGGILSYKSLFELEIQPISFFLLNSVNAVISISKKFLGLLGFILVMPITGLLLLMSMLAFRIFSARLSNAEEEMDQEILDGDDDRLMSLHLALEKEVFLLKKNQGSIEKFNNSWITRPYFRQVNKVFSIIYSVETKLKSHLYPNLNDVLNEADKLRLVKTFANSKTQDWQDDSLDIYQETYG